MSFTPVNDLERDLLHAQNGRLSEEDFLRRLLAAPLVMPVQDTASGGTDTDGSSARPPVQPLFVQDEQGGNVLLLFTSPERARDALHGRPDYPGGLVVELPWILQQLGTGYLIRLNPGFEAGLELEADAIQELLGHHPENLS
jgi:hypothetical protein